MGDGGLLGWEDEEFFGLGDGLEDERPGEAEFEEVFGGGEAGGGLGGIVEAGDAEEEGFAGFFGAEAGDRFDAGFAKCAGEAKEASGGADFLLLRLGKLGEGAIFWFGFGAAMVADGPSQGFPFLAGPAGRNFEAEQKLSSGLLWGLSIARAGAVEARGGAEDAARGFVDEKGAGFDAAEGVEEGDGDAGDLRSAAGARVRGAGGGAEAGRGRGFEATVVGQIAAPFVPEAGLAKGELAISFDALAAFASDDFVPGLAGVFGFGGVGFVDHGGEDVEIVDVAEKILEAFEIVAPRGVMFGQEILDGVAEALEADAESVPGLGFFGAQGAGVEFFGVFEAFKGETLGGEAGDGNEARTLAEMALETAPEFFIEFVGEAEGAFAEFGLAGLEGGVELFAEGIAAGTELADPGVHNLRIAKITKAAEKFAGGFAHGGPGGVGVYLFHDGGQRAAAADGHAQLVDGVHVRSGADAFHFFLYAIHPIRQTPVLGASAGGNGRNGSHQQPRHETRSMSQWDGTPVEHGPIE